MKSRFGANRDEEKMVAVKKLMPESLLRIMDLALQAGNKGIGKGKWGFSKG